MKLRNDDTFGSVNNKGTVVGHQRDFAKEDFFFFNIANCRDVCVSVLIKNRKTNLDLQRHAV